jgi:predicted transcriptional regulator
MLIKSEVSPTNIAKLMAISNSAVSQNRLRMQQKVFDGEGTAKDWDNFILSL